MPEYHSPGFGGVQALRDLLAEREMLRQQQFLEQFKQQELAQRAREHEETLAARRENQANLEHEREYRRESNVQQNLQKGPVSRATRDRLDKHGLATGVVEETPGIRLGITTGLSGIAGLGQSPTPDPSKTTQSDVALGTEDQFMSRGGMRYQEQERAQQAAYTQARAAAAERDALARQVALDRAAQREDDQTFRASESELARQSREEIAAQGRALTGALAAQRGSGLTASGEATVLNRLTTQWDRNTAAGRELGRQHGAMTTAMREFDKNPNASSQVIINTFNKILDPLSVVRESEYARTAEGQALLARLEGTYERLKAGGAGVPKAQLQGFVDLAGQMMNGYRASTVGLRERTRKQAERYQIPTDLIFYDESPASGAPAAPAAPAAAGTAPAAPAAAPRTAEERRKAFGYDK